MALLNRYELYSAHKGKEGLSACDAHGVNPLAWAAMEGHEKVVELLLDSDADINAMTALYAKSHLSWGGSRSVKSYVRHASDGDAWSTGKHTVLYRAAFRGHEAVVQLLIRRGADVNAKGWANSTVLHGASLGGNEDLMRLLLNQGAEQHVNSRSILSHTTPLYCAVDSGSHKVARLLLDHHADVNMQQRITGYTSLHCACENDATISMIELLLEYGAKVDVSNAEGKTALHLAAVHARTSTVNLLLDHGAKVNATTKDGNTALHLAARIPKTATIETLLDHGADVRIINSEGQTALDRSIETERRASDRATRLLKSASGVLKRTDTGTKLMRFDSAQRLHAVASPQDPTRRRTNDTGPRSPSDSTGVHDKQSASPKLGIKHHTTV